MLGCPLAMETTEYGTLNCRPKIQHILWTADQLCSALWGCLPMRGSTLITSLPTQPGGKNNPPPKKLGPQLVSTGINPLTSTNWGYGLVSHNISLLLVKQHWAITLSAETFSNLNLSDAKPHQHMRSRIHGYTERTVVPVQAKKDSDSFWVVIGQCLPAQWSKLIKWPSLLLRSPHQLVFWANDLTSVFPLDELRGLLVYW